MHKRHRHLSPRRRPLTLEPIEPRHLLAFGAELVADVNTQPYSPPTNPSGITEMNGIAYYSATTAANGQELWRSDGTPAGTALLKDIVPGSGSGGAGGLTNVNSTLFFVAHTTENGAELWRSDGTGAGTFLVKDIRPGAMSGQAQSLINANGTLFFIADDGVHGRELWKSDGTAEGTVMVRDIVAGSGSPQPGNLVAAGALVYFTAKDSNNDLRLWRSNGTQAGTFRISEDDSPSNLTAVNDSLFFTQKTAAAGEELWITNGTAVGMRLVEDIKAGTQDSSLGYLTNVNGTLFFGANDGQHGQELWKSDGTIEGTALVRDIDVGSVGYPISFGPRYLFNGNGLLYFTDASSSRLWQSDGTEAGTVPIPGTTPSTRRTSFHIYGGFAEVGGTLYFAARSDEGVELWKTTGPESGKVLVKDIHPGVWDPEEPYAQPYDSFPGDMTNVAGTLLFRAASDTNGYHLWKSDGTAAGTVLIDAIDVWTRSGQVQPLFELNGKLLLTADDGSGVGYWTSDGTAAGTQQLPFPPHATNFANINGTLYFAGAAPSGSGSGIELWKSDGTAAGTVFVGDINPGSDYGYPFSSRPGEFTALDGKVIFAANKTPINNEMGRELWITNGTQTGTALLKDIAPARFASSNPSQLLRLGNFVYFTAKDATHGIELWRTDGTADGTQIVKDIKPNANNGDPQELRIFQNKLYFTANDGIHGRELWQSDGTAAGTFMLKDLAAGAAGSMLADFTEVRGTLYFTTTGVDSAKQLWKTNGTAAGTTLVAEIGTATELTNGGGTLFFVSEVGGTGAELWKSNGTAAGTRRVKDLIPGPGGSHPRELQGANGVLFFEADLPDGGRGFWLSNGTQEGTVPVLQTSPLTNMRYLTNVSGQLYFAGVDAVHGEELWKLTTANPLVQFSGTMTYKENAPLQLIAPFARISDGDNVAFAGGQLSVAINTNAGASDHIEIRNQGNDSGQIGVSGRTIRYGGVVIGSYRAGLPGYQLIIDLNANCSAAIAQALLRNIGYRNDSDNPSTRPRTIVVTLTDGSGGISAPISKTVTVQAVNDPPQLVLGGSLAYQNNASAVLLAAAATVTDPDSANFFNGVLTVDITSGRGPSNRLLVGGAYTIQSGQLLRSGVVVGTVLENGVGWNALKFRFNAQMTPAKVQELVRSLRFGTIGNTNLASRIISFHLTDGDGGSSAIRTKTVNLAE